MAISNLFLIGMVVSGDKDLDTRIIRAFYKSDLRDVPKARSKDELNLAVTNWSLGY